MDLSFQYNWEGKTVNQLDEKAGSTMQWLDFGSDMTAMFIVVAVAAIGLGVFFFTRRHIE